MCLGVPGQIVQIGDSALQLATVDVCGVQRQVNISLICDSDPQSLLGKWVLVHVGFAMSITLPACLPTASLRSTTTNCNGLFAIT